MIIRKFRFASIFTVVSLLGALSHVGARENIVTSAHKTQKTTAPAVGCQPAISAIDLDINNVAARLMTGGDMWWNIGEQVAAYEIPINSGKSSQFAASCWIGGIDQQGQLKVAAQTYRQDGNDYWPGALTGSKITSDACANWDKFWKIDRSTINTFIQVWKAHGDITADAFAVINQWPAMGNAGAAGANGPLDVTSSGLSYAPFVDVDKNGLYDPSGGDYPDINGDQYIWWVFNDAGNVKQQSLTAAIGVEIQTSAFAYATQDYLNDATFYNYRVYNRGALTIDSTYIAVWDDCDLGYYFDDFIGCDVPDGLGIQYNGSNDDGAIGGHPVNSYGLNPPQVGMDFFKGPIRQVHYARPGKSDSVTDQQLQMTNFTYYNNDASEIGNPTNGIQIYYYMTGSIRNGQRFSDDFQGPGIQSKGYGSGPVSNFVFTGDPGNKTTWSECTCNNNPGDRRFIFSSGPFTLYPGAKNDITFGCIWANGVGGCPNTSFTNIKSIDGNAQALFDANFKTVEGPQAPRMVCRELDRRLIFYLVNDYGSNNYNENYGRTDKTSTANYADSVQYQQTVTEALALHSPDSLYKFEGYRVFQLANSQVTPAEIFDPTTGQVDNTKAIEVFQCDITDSVGTIINYVKDGSIPGDTTYIPQIKVEGRDSGIKHSFEITEDQFSTTSDKRLVNYQNYYFVAIAYAYNDFSFNKTTGRGGFDPRNPVATQSSPYLGSAHGANGVAIPVVAALPNPANGAMGTIINSDYGSGIIVTRIEGQGNGGNVVELDSLSEVTAVDNGQVDSALYMNSQGPINVKVIDPTLVPNYNWVMQISGGSKATFGISDTGLWTLTAYQNGKPVDTIYSSNTIGTVNEQILEKYGLSVEVNQTLPPGVNQGGDNGYITSSIQFEDQSQAWLSGIADQADSSEANWLRSGNNHIYSSGPFNGTSPCNYNDYKLDTNVRYEKLLSNYTPTTSTWGPYVLAAAYFGEHSGFTCSFEVAYAGAATQTAGTDSFANLPDVDLVFTSDKKQWTRCAVVEMEEDPSLAQGGAAKFTLRNHAGWNLGWTGTNTPTYSSDPADKGMSYFPGYAINVGTGQRLNIVFGEDSYLGSDNGSDMLWNPTGNLYSSFDGSVIWGGKHVIYISGTKYDSDAAFVNLVKTASLVNFGMQKAYSSMQWVGIPTLNPLLNLASIQDGIIPTKTRLQFRVDRPYAPFEAVDTSTLTVPVGIALTNGQKANPLYTFSTSNLAPTAISDTTNRSSLLNRIYAVPNPYYGYSGYETNRFDTRVRIINLPAQATIYIYALDGSLIRTLTKNDPTTSYIDWDIRNSVGLPVASGMYLMDVKANGIGETIVKWFGATRPIDVTTY